ncbi:unnamed protein product [Chondrus crispus]|uniref:Uncharacterized protein n=1 Tax=Chondrus crispus TaxID=2769 RepID=R7QS33_CHOCR|nr:unnamed protein product [Chondrus crispus]CDF40929.1 unnamed protein product [Chondrus crispus]|eukprot:XP_005711223.1 unnamed protein product [Chondrus crispus]
MLLRALGNLLTLEGGSPSSPKERVGAEVVVLSRGRSLGGWSAWWGWRGLCIGGLRWNLSMAQHPGRMGSMPRDQFMTGEIRPENAIMHL